ncbi:hypothetical protein SAMN05192569_107111 [Parageobacillus thermantarcticus]|uniref:Uncharacterized protein n=1 Tax=Parageobacillus thermantarcticus TaxID=186116 RepID=A0A1I0TWT0_9BACL|nr:hypothetical protein SAMN05192569_101570 [Parageobacillus thermantarcticus]SFA56281.1 hypothetical protein SAMN05192569_107111 [Parageobacillus thermantarcticus]
MMEYRIAIPHCYTWMAAGNKKTIHRLHQGIYQEQPSRLKAGQGGRTICDLHQE